MKQNKLQEPEAVRKAQEMAELIREELQRLETMHAGSILTFLGSYTVLRSIRECLMGKLK